DERELGLECYGIVDDVWLHSEGELIIVDYKSTGKDKHYIVNPIGSKWDRINQRQLSFYAILFKKNGYNIHPKGYLVYSIAVKDNVSFNQMIAFDMAVQRCDLDGSWYEPTMRAIRNC